jgi:SecD/SecF fusion protein
LQTLTQTISQKEGTAETAFLDSVANNPIFGFTSYADAKKKELNKGLDLKGGINVTLQISVKDISKRIGQQF